MNEYEKQAREFLRRAAASVTICRAEIVDRFPNADSVTGYRWKYRVTIRRGGRSWTFPFYDSIHNYQTDKRPRPYDILACLQKYPVSADVWDFAEEYGYTIDSRESFKRVERIHTACEKEYNNVLRIFGNDPALLAELQEIS